MQHGWRWQRSTFRSVSLPLATRRAGAGPVLLLHFVVMSKLLSCLHERHALVGAAVLIVVVPASWRMSMGSV